MKELIKAAAAHGRPVVPEGFESRVMIEIARRAIARSRRRAKIGLAASLSGLAMLLAACVAMLVAWFPGDLWILERLPSGPGDAAGGGLSVWLGKVFGTAHESAIAAARETTGAMPFLEQWSGVLVLVLVVGSAVGFVYCLNNLFSSDVPGVSGSPFNGNL